MQPKTKPGKDEPDKIVSIVGIGASAGGLKTLVRFLSVLPEEFDFAVVFVQHLTPKHESLLPELLRSRRPDMEINEISDGLVCLPGQLYLCPPAKEVRIQKGTFRITPRSDAHVHLPVDEFFLSLAGDASNRAIAVVFSGAGTDGARGVEAVRSAGGTIFVQDPVTAEFPGMPLAAINTGHVDGVLSPEDIAREILKFHGSGMVTTPTDGLITTPQFEFIYQLIYEKTGYRFHHYKKNVVARRIRRRMYLQGISSAHDYLELVTHNDSEVAQLAADLMIGVTSFFRDRLAWKDLHIEVTRKLAAEDDDAPIRVWTPACATGEEAYSIAMQLRHELDLAGRKKEIQVFATDVNDKALEQAREATYPASTIADLPPGYTEKFFTYSEDYLSVTINKEIRQYVVLARQDLLFDPPFSRLDLIICRNLLIYLEPDAQEKCITLFHYALKEGRYLFLGNAESSGRKNDLFTSIGHKKCRLYRKVEKKPSARLPLTMPFAAEHTALILSKQASAAESQPSVTQFIQEALLEEYAPAAVAINQSYDIIYHNGPTNRYLRQPRGVPTRNFLELIPKNMRNRIRSALYRAAQEARPVSIRTSINGDDERKRQVAIRISKLGENFFTIIFQEKGGLSEQTEAIVSEAAVIEGTAVYQLEKELSATRDDLQSHIEQLKSLNEELQSSNEELQAANEELETSREELQSLNEELITVNTQLQMKIEEQEETNNDLNNFLASTSIPTIFLDHRLRVKRFTPAMSRLIKLIPADVGRPITDMSQEHLGPDLIADAQAILDNLTPIKKELCINGAWYIRTALPYRTSDNRIEGVVVTYSDVAELKQAEEALHKAKGSLEIRVAERTAELEEINRALGDEITERKQAEEAVKAERQRFYDVLETLPAYVVLLTPDYHVPFANRVFRELFGESHGRCCFEYLFGRTEPCEICETYSVLKTMKPHRWEWTGPNGHNYNVYDFPFTDTDGSTMILEMGMDITDRKRAEEELQTAISYNRKLIEVSLDPLVTIGSDGKITDVNAATEAVTGRSRGELIGTDFADYFTQPGKARAGYEQVFREGLVRDYALEIRHHNGHITPVLYNAVVYRNDAGNVIGVFAAARDVTDRKRAEEELHRYREHLEELVKQRTSELEDRNARLADEVTERKRHENRITNLTRLYQVLSQVNEAIVRIRDEGSLFAEACRIAAEEEKFSLVWIGVVKGQQVVPVASCGREADYLKRIKVEIEGKLGMGPTGTCIRENQPVVNNDFATNPTTSPWREPALRHGFHSSAAFPLRRQGKAIGAFTLYAFEPDAFDSEQVSLLESLSADISYALDALDQEQLRTRTEEELIRAKEEWERTFASVPDMVAILDNRHRVLRVNAAMARRLGAKVEECIGLPCYEAVHGLSGPPEFCPHSRTMEDSRQHIVEIHEDRLGGDFEVSTTPMYDGRGKVIGSVHVAHDITEHKRAENIIRHSLSRFALLAETASTLLQASDPQGALESLALKAMEFLNCHVFFNFLADEKTGRLHLNAYAGIPDEEAMKIKWLDYGVAVCGCAARDACRIVAEHIPTTPDVRTELVKSYGVKAYACHPLLGPGEKVIGTLSFGTRNRETFSDEDLSLMKAVTDQVATAMVRMKAEKELKKAHEDLETRIIERTEELQEAYNRLIEETKERDHLEEQLRHAQKMDAIGTLAGGIAHDFNNIIAGIIGFAEMVLEDVPGDSPVHRRLEFILKGAYRGRDLVKQILTFSRRGEQEKKPVSMSLVIMEVIPLIRAIIPSTIEIRHNILTESDIISADQTQIHQVVLNLCSNAAYAMHDQGGVLEIVLKDEIVTSEDYDVHPELKPGPYIRLIVSDTGCGMEPEILDRIFDPFFTTKASGEGTGLGLSVVHGIIRSHGGAISVYSKPGQGSSFHVIIPKIVSDVALERKEITRTPRGEGQILVVDDEDLLTEMSRQRLERLGYSVVGKTDSIEALEIFRADPDRFDLVVTDYTMPNMTGFDLSKEILHIRPDVPIIMCSGSHEPVPREKIEEIGIRDFFQKPIGNDDFARLVQDVLDKSRQRDIGKDG